MEGMTAIIQARMTSSRLPGKLMLPILGKPMLLRQVERLKHSRCIDDFVLATSTYPSDDAVEVLAREAGVGCFRGSLDDVLDRFYGAARQTGGELFVRLTGDCPLADPAVIDALIDFYHQGGYDYASNTLECTFPDGLDAEVFSLNLLETAWKEAKKGSEREHVTPFFYNHPERFRLGSFKSPEDLSGLRWTVDERDDFDVIVKIYEALYPANPAFTTADVIAWLTKNPHLKTLNVSRPRNEGYQKSLAQDRQSEVNP